MADSQSIRLAVAFAQEAAKSPEARLCTACVSVLSVSGAGITVMSGQQSGPVCVSNTRIAALEDLQFALGEGPCQDAFRTGQPVHVPALRVSSRWPSFADLASVTGIGAVFAFPLSTPGAKVGVLTIYQDLEGDLTQTQCDDSVALSAVLTETLLSLQAAAPEGTLAAGLDDVVAYRAEIHQATGMVSIQLRVPVAEALLRIRAHAFSSGQPVGVVATAIVNRRLRLDDDRGFTNERS
jgi:GAF domain